MNDQYAKLKDELPAIAELVKLFPDNLQSKVFDLLAAQLFGRDLTKRTQSSSDDISEQNSESPDGDLAGIVKWTPLSRHNLGQS